MHPCLIHPHVEAAGTCEYCAQPHCAACLTLFMGRRYCGPCYARVHTLATGSPPPVVLTAPSGPPAAYSAGKSGPRLPGWLSALLYLIGFAAVLFASQQIAAVPLLVAKRIVGTSRATLDLMSAADIGLKIWTPLFAVFAWACLISVLAYTAVMAHQVERRSLAEMGLRFRNTVWRDLFLGLALAVVLFVSIVGVGLGADWYTIRPAALAVEALVIPGIGFLLLLPLAAVEEIAMRGYVLQAVARWKGTGAGVAVSTAAFALLHGLNPHLLEHPLAIAGLLLAGLYLATAYVVTRSLWLPIFLHTAWNVLEGPVFGLPVSGARPPAAVFDTAERLGAPALWTGGAFGPEASLLLCIVLLAHIGALWGVRSLFSRSPGPAPPLRTTGATRG